MRMFGKTVQQARSENLSTPHTSHKGSGRGCPLLRASSDYCFIVGTLRARRAPGHSPLSSSTSSLAATSHVVDQRTIDVGATEADGIEEGIRIRDKVLLVGELISNDLGVAGIAQHHQPTGYAYRFSPRTPSHSPLHRPFLPRQPKVFSFEIDPAHSTFVDLRVCRKLNFLPNDASTADMVKPPTRVLVI